MKRATAVSNGFLANESDLRILRNLFKWKILPSTTCKQISLPNDKPKTFEKRIDRLLRRGMIQRLNHIGRLRLLQLTQDGFNRIRNDVDRLKEEGFLSESIWHDFMVLVFHLGFWAVSKPKTVDLVSEQELRRFYAQDLPYWVPRTDTHRPDGFTRLSSTRGSRILAIEVELSRKESDRYEFISQYYAENRNIDFILWLVKNKSMLDQIKNCVARVDSSRIDDHIFILFDEYADKLWKAKIVSGHKTGHDLIDLLSECHGFDVGTLSVLHGENTLLDFRKKILNGLNR